MTWDDFKQRAARFVAWVDDHANPIVVKEVRTHTRGKGFLIFFILLLVGSMVAAASAPTLTSRNNQAVGDELFVAFAACLIIIAFGAIPWSAHRSVLVEQDQNTWDMLRVSGLSPHRLVLGKLNAAGLQLLIFFSAVTPFMAMSYVLRGIDIITIVVAAGLIVSVSMLLSMTTIWLAALVGTRPQGILMQILVVVGSVVAVWHGIGILGDLGDLFGGTVGSASYWASVGATFLGVAAHLVLLYAMAVTQFTFETANRSTPPRLALLGYLLLLGGGLVLYHEGNWIRVGASLLEGTALWPAVLVYVAGIITLAEGRPLPRRVRNTMSSNPIVQLFAMFFYPGPGRGMLYLLLLAVVMFVLPALLIPTNAKFFPSPLPLLWAAGYVVAFAGLSSAVTRRLCRGHQPRLVVRWLSAMITFAVLIVPWLVFQAVGHGKAPAWLVAFQPIQAIGDGLWRSPAGPWVSIGIAIAAGLAVLVHLPAIVADLREQFRVAADRRAGRLPSAAPPSTEGSA